MSYFLNPKNTVKGGKIPFVNHVIVLTLARVRQINDIYIYLRKSLEYNKMSASALSGI